MVHPAVASGYQTYVEVVGMHLEDSEKEGEEIVMRSLGEDNKEDMQGVFEGNHREHVDMAL